VINERVSSSFPYSLGLYTLVPSAGSLKLCITLNTSMKTGYYVAAITCLLVNIIPLGIYATKNVLLIIVDDLRAKPYPMP